MKPRTAFVPSESAALETEIPLLEDGCWPDISNLVIRDDTPVESIFAEKQYRLLTEALYASWGGPPSGKSFIAFSNVGLFYKHPAPPVVPDMMLAFDTQFQGGAITKENNSYFLWLVGHPPVLVFELVSDRRGGEDTTKLKIYSDIGVAYYVVYDPGQHLSQQKLRCYSRQDLALEPMDGATFSKIGLGVTIWEGYYEEFFSSEWLRWCDLEGQLILCGKELADQERQRADHATQLADQATQRADQATQLADAATQRADQATQLAERLAARLRELGIDPDL